MHPKLKKTVRLCKDTEEEALKFYQSLQKQSDSNEDKAFWQGLAKDEAVHISFWTRLEKLGGKQHIKNPFHDIDETNTRLKVNLETIRSILKKQAEPPNPEEALRRAVLIEMMLLHPAITILFRSLKKYTDGISPEDDYLEHIGKISEHSRRYSADIGWRLHISALEQMLYQSHEIADQITRIDNLEGLIPICAWCKNVRDEENNWIKVESYISRHSASEFTHGICPKCAEKW
ncbi:hypothetical protein KKI24_10710 [bacterium]|nr:hypothetical protein [bacterium]